MCWVCLDFIAIYYGLGLFDTARVGFVQDALRCASLGLGRLVGLLHHNRWLLVEIAVESLGQKVRDNCVGAGKAGHYQVCEAIVERE
jgi:hypothetical protein